MFHRLASKLLDSSNRILEDNNRLWVKGLTEVRIKEHHLPIEVDSTLWQLLDSETMPGSSAYRPIDKVASRPWIIVCQWHRNATSSEYIFQLLKIDGFVDGILGVFVV